MISPWTLWTNPETNAYMLIIKTFKGFKLFLTIVAGFKNKIQNEVNRLGWRKTFGIVTLV